MRAGRFCSLKAESAQFVGYLNHPARIHYVVGCVQYALIGEDFLHARVGELAAIADAWIRWYEADTGWFQIPNGEIIGRA